MFPVIQYLRIKKKKLSDIEFLAIKEFDGKLKKNEGFLSTTGDLATLTASSGKDMYLARAKINWVSNTGVASFQAVEAVLKVNGVVVETTKHLYIGNSVDAMNTTVNYEFKNIGHKVAATQIIKIEIITLPATMDAEGFIECFEEATGASPAV